MNDREKQCLLWISEIQAIAQSGLAYTTNEFDVERFHRLLALAAEMTSKMTQLPIEQIHQMFTMQTGYATPRLDIRSFVLQDDKILLVRERADNRWTLPGGFADVNETPAEAVVRETKEEAGYDVVPVKILALWDTLKHNHPLQWPHIYKCVFYCEMIGGEPMANLEISEVKFFSINELPELSTPRITAEQLNILYKTVKSNSDSALFD